MTENIVMVSTYWMHNFTSSKKTPKNHFFTHAATENGKMNARLTQEQEQAYRAGVGEDSPYLL